jgi:hypothetical protein
MKFINSSYDPETGLSTVVMQHLGIKFFGSARLHPDDKESASKYGGCIIAELRATISALKYERTIAKQKADEAIDFMKACEGYANFDKDSPTAKVMYRQVNRRIKRVNDITDEINNLIKEVQEQIYKRKIVINAIKRKKTMTKKDN